MIKNISTNKLFYNKTAKIIILILVTPIVLLLLIFAWNFVTRPVFDKFDQDRFTKLDTNMQNIFKKFQTASRGSEDWRYKAVCSANMSGWMTTGDYNCVTSISAEKIVGSAKEVSDLHSKYYPLIDNSSNLEQKTEIDLEPPNEFGKKFAVSSAEKRYKEVYVGISCRYIFQLDQLVAENNNEYGSMIEGANGDATISLRCEDTARNHWYGLQKSTSMLIP